MRRRPRSSRWFVATRAAATLSMAMWSIAPAWTRSPRHTIGTSLRGAGRSSSPRASGLKITPSTRWSRMPRATSSSRSRTPSVWSMSTVHPRCSAATMIPRASSAKYGDVEVGHGEGDHPGAPAAQAARREVRPVAEGGDGLGDALAGAVADVRVAVDHVGGGLDRHPGPLRHILQPDGHRHRLPSSGAAPGPIGARLARRRRQRPQARARRDCSPRSRPFTTMYATL